MQGPQSWLPIEIRSRQLFPDMGGTLFQLKRIERISATKNILSRNELEHNLIVKTHKIGSVARNFQDHQFLTSNTLFTRLFPGSSNDKEGSLTIVYEQIDFCTFRDHKVGKLSNWFETREIEGIHISLST